MVELCTQDKFLILATDGVWEFIDPQVGIVGGWVGTVGSTLEAAACCGGPRFGVVAKVVSTCTQVLLHACCDALRQPTLHPLTCVVACACFCFCRRLWTSSAAAKTPRRLAAR